MMGVTASPAETHMVARLIAIKLSQNDALAFKRLGEAAQQGLLSVAAFFSSKFKGVNLKKNYLKAIFSLFKILNNIYIFYFLIIKCLNLGSFRLAELELS